MSSEGWFDGVSTVVAEPLKFKAKLAIGEDAYTSLRLKKTAYELWDAMGAATTVSAVAKSSAVASTFFAPTGLLSAIGIGTAATPIGWVIAAGVVSGGAWIGMSKYIKQSTRDRVIVIPEFINTPIDILGLSLFELTSPLLLQVAVSDGYLDNKERELIKDYFIHQWGYSDIFVEKGLSYIEQNRPEKAVYEFATALANYKKKNPDCNFHQMTAEIIEFVEEVVEIDGKVTNEERIAIEAMRRAFNEVGESLLQKTTKQGLSNLRKTKNKLLSFASKIGNNKLE